MNDMTIALKKAGVKVPSLRLRIWNVVKANPRCAADKIAAVLGVQPELAQKTLYALAKAGTVTSENLQVGHKSYLHYTTVGDEYTTVRPVLVKAVDCHPTPDGFDPRTMCDDLTLGQLKALRGYINSVLK